MDTLSHTDEQLLEELKKRFDVNKKAMNDLRAMTQKLEEVNKRLQESERVKSNFLSNIKNEINNPLSSILGLSEQLISPDALDADVIKSVSHTIFSEAKDLDFQLRNIFTAAEMESGDVELSPAQTNVCQLLNNLIDSVKNKVFQKKQRVIYKPCDDASFTFMTDAEKLQVAISNLIINAIEFSHEGSDITIKTEKLGERLHITVTDQGIGIAEENHKRVFDRFAQLDTGVRKNFKGHGLGLSISKALVEMMNGSIEIKSSLGEGSTFTIIIGELEARPGETTYSDNGNEFFFEDDGEMEEF